MRTGRRPADVAAKYPQDKPDLSRFVKFQVPSSHAQQGYAAAQFVPYLAGGGYSLALGDGLHLPVLLLGWA